MSSPEVDFDVVVVGAGPAGSVAAARLASAGHSVVLIERGEAPGAKNLSGGVLYGRVLDDLLPGFAGQAPVERRITRHVTTFLNADSAVSLDYSDSALAEPVNAVTVLRARFDEWLAAQAEAAGAFSMPTVKVDGLLTQPGPAGTTQVVGVRAGEDELRSRIVVAADGVNSFLARSIGLRRPPRTDELALGVKAVIALDPARIEDRFGVRGDEGAAHALVGDCTQGLAGGAFLYTNRESLSLGVVLRLDELVASGRRSAEVFEHCCAHPALAPYLEGSELVEYGSHLVAEGGLAMLGNVSTGGFLVVGEAAGLTINSGFAVRGMDLAIGSAMVAADVIHEALGSGDVSATALAPYRRRLLDSTVGRDLDTYSRAPLFLQRQRLYGDYGRLAAAVFRQVFGLDTTPRKHLRVAARQALADSPISMAQVASDVWSGMRAL